jgi:hypothetical protein
MRSLIPALLASLSLLAPTAGAVAAHLTVEEQATIAKIERICRTRVTTEPVFAIYVSDPTDEVFAHATELSRLHTLAVLYGPRVTDRAMEHVKKLGQLESLRLHSTRITDRGLRHLRDVPSVRELDLYGTPVRDKGLKALEKMCGLKRLNVGRTEITDKGLESISKLVHLRVLILSHTQVTDKGLLHLATLNELELLLLNGTKVSDPTVNRLNEMIPGVVVQR